MVYFDGGRVWSVHVESLEDALLFTLPGDREQSARIVSRRMESGWAILMLRKGAIVECREGSQVDAFNFDTKEQARVSEY